MKIFKNGILIYNWILKYEIQKRIIIEKEYYAIKKDNFSIKIQKLEKTKNEYRNIIKEITLFKYKF